MAVPATASRRRRGEAAARAAWGAAMVIAPGLALRGLGGRPRRTATVIVRLLGVRHLVQSTLTWLRPTDRTIAVGAAVDATHAASALAAAALGAHRRTTLASAAAATGWAALGVAELAPTPRARRR
jgi:hypothetical protein